jgi:hypothetical protein
MDDPPNPNTNLVLYRRRDPTANCWLCNFPFDPTRIYCPRCKGVVVPTQTPVDRQPIIWTLAIVDVGATDAEWEDVVKNAKEISTTQNNIAICGTDAETGRRAILVRQGESWDLSFWIPDSRSENTTAKKITTQKLDRFSTIIGLTTTGRGRLGLPYTKRRLQPNLPQLLDGYDHRGCSRR